MRKGEEERPYIIWAEHAVQGERAMAGERRLNRALETARRIMRTGIWTRVWIVDRLGATVAHSMGQRMLDGSIDGYAMMALADGVTLPGRYDQASGTARQRRA